METAKALFLAFFLFSFSVEASSAEMQAYDPTSDLISAFGGKCEGNGAISSSALNEGADLKHIIESISSTPSCKAVEGALENINNLNIDQLLREKRSMDDIEDLALQANDLEQAIASETRSSSADPEYIAGLKSDLRDVKISLLKARKQPNRERTYRRLETIGNLQKYTNTLLARLKQNEQCLVDQPNLPAQVGAQLLGLGSTLASGMVGALMLATGSVIDNFVGFIQTKKLAGKLRQLSSSRMGSALGCSFEGLARTYCEARDIEAIIKLNNEASKTAQTGTWMDGVAAMGDDVQSYMDWVSNVDAGTPAATSGRAIDKKAALQLQADLRSVRIDLQGMLNTAKRTVEQSSNKADATRQALNDLAAKMQPKSDCTNGTCVQTGPFIGVFSSDPTCGPLIYLYSKGDDKVRDDQGTIPCATYVAKKYKDLPDIKSKAGEVLEKLLSEATQSVNIKLSQVNESNPDLVVAQVDSRKQSRRSAREFMSSAIGYLSTLLKDPSSIAGQKAQNRLITKTKQQLEKAIMVIDRYEESEKAKGEDASDGAKKSEEAAKKLADLSKELIPEGDTSAIPKALSEIIDQDIDQKLATGKIDDNLATLTKLSSAGSLAELIKYFIGLEASRTQARTAQELSEENLSALAGVFRESLEDRLKKLKEKAKDDDKAKDSLALLCMQALAVPEAPKIGDTNLKDYCSGQVYSDLNNSASLKMEFDILADKKHPDRVCAVYDFYRKSRLKEKRRRQGMQPGSSGESQSANKKNGAQ